MAIAKPELAPNGTAAVESLHAAGLWDRVQPKIVYADNINMAKQYGASGNADAVLTAYSLVLKDGGKVIQVDSSSARAHRSGPRDHPHGKTSGGREAIHRFFGERQRPRRAAQLRLSGSGTFRSLIGRAADPPGAKQYSKTICVRGKLAV